MDECMLNDLLECSVCLERLDTSSKVLPCQHTFCKKCLEEIINRHRELRCPECRVLVDIKIDDLPPNVLLMRILEGMRNATPKNTKLLHLKNIQQQQQQRNFGNQQIVTTTQISAVNTNVVSPVVSVTVDPTRHANASAKQVHLHNQPYGRAIYDYISKVPGDLSFKKGDIVVLRKKIDNNWYYGESGTNHGVFPLSYVQVMTPLPPHVPQCKALYDFRMRNDEEDGCLTFNKGEVISVIRRVDENWAEGKLLDRIGIFPLAFVELNSVARALMKLSTNVQPGPSRVAPPTPTNEETTPLIPTDHSRNIQTSNQPRPQAVPSSTSLLVSDSSSSTVSSGGSSATTSPNTPNSSTTSSSSSSTAPSSPSSPALSPQNTSGIQRVKRHSFTGINTTNPPPQLHSHSHHRHSAEILSQPDTNNDNNTTTTTTINETFSSSVNSTAITVTITTTTNSIPSTTVTSSTAAATTTTTTATINSSIPSVEHNIRHRRSGSSDLVLNQTNLPSAYIALYPYKPQKVDELELRKGGIYMVTERCQDGWFKGTSNRTQKCGVFPGNYVAPAKCQRGICRITNTSSTNHQASSVLSTTTTTTTTSTTTTNNQAINDSRLPVTYTKSKNNVTAQAYSPRSLPPPELPPRALSPSSSSSGVSVSWHGQAQQNSPRLGGCEQGPGNPLGRSHSAVMSNNSISSSPGKTMLTPSLAAGNTSCSSSENNRSPNNTLRLTGGLTPPPNTLVGNASLVGHSSAAKSTEKIKSKEKKEKGVSLMRRLTNIKKSKSPPPTTYSMDNPVFDDGNFVSSADAVHVRSGSCPSQLLEMRQPQDSPSKTNHHRLYPGNVQGNATTSQRIKHKERPSLPVSFLQRSGEAGAVVTPGSGNHHRKSNSLDAGIGKQNKQQSASRERERVNRFRCIVPYPPNSEFELELRVGDIIYVQKKRDDGWYKGTQQRTGRTGLFPASFVEAF